MTTSEKSRGARERLKGATKHLQVALLELDPMVDKAPFESVLEELRMIYRQLDLVGTDLNTVLEILERVEKSS